MDASRISSTLLAMNFSATVVEQSLEAIKDQPMSLQNVLDWIFENADLSGTAWATTPAAAVPARSPAPLAAHSPALPPATPAVDTAPTEEVPAAALSDEAAIAAAVAADLERTEGGMQVEGPEDGDAAVRVPKIGVSEQPLTAEEARRRAMELQARIRREQEQKERDAELEKERARRAAGKEAIKENDEIQQIRLRLAREEKARAARENQKALLEVRAKLQAEKERRAKEAEARRARAAPPS